MFFGDSVLGSCTTREGPPQEKERVSRLYVTILNNSESLPGLGLECSVLTQRDDWPLSVERGHRGGEWRKNTKDFPSRSKCSRNFPADMDRLVGDIATPSALGLGRSSEPRAPRLVFLTPLGTITRSEQRAFTPRIQHISV